MSTYVVGVQRWRQVRYPFCLLGLGRTETCLVPVRATNARDAASFAELAAHLRPTRWQQGPLCEPHTTRVGHPLRADDGEGA